MSTRPQLRHVTEVVNDARARGGRMLAGGTRLNRPGFFFAPTIVADVDASARLVAEEQFGPALPVVTYRDFDDAVAQANATHYGLSASVWTSDVVRSAEVARRLECGTAWVNKHVDLGRYAPFGGFKWRGIGRENGCWRGAWVGLGERGASCDHTRSRWTSKPEVFYDSWGPSTASTGDLHMRQHWSVTALFGALALGLASGLAHAACNVIPGTELSFVGDLGTLNRPFAAPGDTIVVRLGRCDGLHSDGFVAAPGQLRALDVHVVFKPPVANGTNTAVAVAGATLGADDRSLRIPFPATPGDGLAGPTMVVVSKLGTLQLHDAESLSCAQLVARCGGMCPDIVACADRLLQPSGSCALGAPQPAFATFTGLPPANDYKSLCTEPACAQGHEADTNCCLGDADALRFSVDTAGNILVPMKWNRILPNTAEPVPRLLLGSANVPKFEGGNDPVVLPGRGFVSSFSPEGSRLDPIFEPQSDPAQASEVVLFGSADAPYTVLRIARRSPAFRVCIDGGNVGRPCVDDADCPDATAACQQAECVGGGSAGQACSSNGPCGTGSCGPVCFGGTHDGDVCTSDGDCPNGECGESLFDFRDRMVNDTGPVVVDSVTGVRAVMRQAGDPYALEAGELAPLGGLFQTPVLSAFVVREALDNADHNNDNDMADSFVSLRHRRTGTPLQLAGNDRMEVKIITPVAPFRFPAVAVENDVLAFIQPTGALRVFKVEHTPLPTDPPTATPLTNGSDIVLTDALVDGKSLVVSDGLVFVRRVIGPDTKLSVFDARTPSGLADLGTVDPTALASVAGGAAIFLDPTGQARLALARTPLVEDLGLKASTAAIGGVCTGGAPTCRTDNDCSPPATCDPTYLAVAASEAPPVGDLNGDNDTNDFVLRVRPAVGGPWVMPQAGLHGQAADEIGVAGSVVAFTTLEADQFDADRTDDQETVDRVLQVYEAVTEVLRQPLDADSRMLPVTDFLVSQGIVAFRVNERQLCNNFDDPNPQTNNFDFPALSDPVPDIQDQDCYDGGCGPDEHCDVNGDGDCCDRVLMTYDPVTSRRVNSLQQTQRCDQAACDPRRPYRIVTAKACRLGNRVGVSCTVDADCGDAQSGAYCADVTAVKFLTVECQQGCFESTCRGGQQDGQHGCVDNGDCSGGGICDHLAQCIEDPSYDPGRTVFESCSYPSQTALDLNGDGDIRDTIVQILDTETGKVTPVATAGPGTGEESDPLDGTGTAFGRCVLGTLNAPVTCTTTCQDDGAYCDPVGGVCVLRSPGTCRTSDQLLYTPEEGQSAECMAVNPNSFCDTTHPTSIAPGDTDLDTVPDTVDNCPFVANTTQEDTDVDDVGDACDLSTCGNGIREAAEECDDSNTVDGDGCDADCTVEVGAFRMYRADVARGAPAFTSVVMTLADPYETVPMHVVRPVGVGAPVDVDGAGIDDPATFLNCYRIKYVAGTSGTAGPLTVLNRFGRVALNRLSPQTLCVASEKTGTPSPLTLDAFKCYKARTVSPTARVEADLTDEFRHSTGAVRQATNLCVPVGIDGSTVRQPAGLLTCYKLRDVSAQGLTGRNDFTFANRFGSQPLSVLLKSQTSGTPARSQLCVPSTIAP